MDRPSVPRHLPANLAELRESGWRSRTVKAELVLYEPRTTALVPVNVRTHPRRPADGRGRRADAHG